MTKNNSMENSNTWGLSPRVMRININMRHNVLLLLALLVCTSMYGRSGIDTIRITFAQVDGYATSRSTVSYAYQNDEYQLQTTEPSFPHRIKDLPNTINKGCVSKLLNDVSLYSDKSQCDYISITKEDYADYIKTLNNRDSLIYYFPQLDFHPFSQDFKKEQYELTEEEFLSLSCADIINMIRAPHRLFLANGLPMKVELLSAQGENIVIEPLWNFEDTAWKLVSSEKEAYIGHEYMMSFLRDIRFDKYAFFWEKRLLLFQIAEGIVENKEQENIYWEDVAKSKQDSILGIVDADILAIYQGKTKITDNDKSFEILDKLCAKEVGIKRALYFLLFNQIMRKADGAVAEVMGEYCMRNIENNADFIIQYLANHESYCHLYAEHIAIELHMSNTPLNEYDKKIPSIIKPETKASYPSFINSIREHLRQIKNVA